MSRFLRLPTFLALGLLAALAMALAAFLFAAGSGGPVHAAVGGPVILGGDDLTDHGSIDGGGNLIDGWLYIRRALENISPQVTRAGNDGSVAVLGSGDSTATSGNAGAAYHFAAPQAGLGVSFHNGATAINQFFTDLTNGTVNPAIIVTAGSGASNDLNSSEGVALTNNAIGIANFVNSGGGLLSHGKRASRSYGWLSALLPGLSAVSTGGSGDLALTSAGQAAFPGITNANINAGPWHDHFEPQANFGGLQVLAIDTDDNDSQGNPRAVIIGGAQVTLPGSISLTPGTATNVVGTSHTVTATARESSPPAPAVGVTVTFTVTGDNAGATGACSPNADCTTDQGGKVSFTYIGTAAGTDTIEASFVDATETRQSTLVQKTWELPPPSIALDPPTATNELGTDHTVTATVTDANGPVPGADVTFEVLAGSQNVGAQGTCSANADCTTAANGEVSFTYTSDGVAGTDTIEACFLDQREQLQCTTATKEWGVPLGAANDPPVAVDDSATVFKDSTNNVIDVLANDSDPDGDTLTVTNVSDPENGTATVGSVKYTPKAGFGGKDTFTYTISDGTDTDTATVTVDVVAAPPKTGGAPSDGGSGALPWMAAIAGALALMGAGSGLWLAHQRRRVR